MKFFSVLFREKKYYPFIVFIIALLIGQAYCELKLPSYTSDIVDVGIMQGGIEDAVPSEIRVESLDGLKRFMTEAERDIVTAAYTPGDDGVLTLGSEYKSGREQRAELADILKIPEVLMIQIGASQSAQSFSGTESIEATGMDESGEASAEAAIIPDEELLTLIGTVMAGQGTDADVTAIKNEIEGQLADLGLGDSMLDTAAVEYVRSEYEALGLDMQAIQLDYMLKMALTMVVFTLIACAAAIVAGLLASIAAAGTGQRLRRDIFTQIMSYSNTEMDRFSPASLITRSTNDIQQIQMAMVMFLRMVLFAPAMAVGGIIMVTRADTGLSWVIVAVILVLAAVIGTLLGLTLPKFKRMQALIDDVNLVSREILTGLPVIRAFNRESYEKQRFEKTNQALYKTQRFTNRAMSMFMPIVFFIMNITMIVIVWFGGHAIDSGEMQVGDLMAFISYTMFIVMSFMMLSMVTIMIPRSAVAAGRVLEVINTESTIEDKPADELKHEDDHFTGNVAFENVSFRYHDADEDTLSHINFTAEPGKMTAIIGGTGSGKSTLINLLPRLFDVTRGKVTIDGVDVRDLSQKKLRSLIGVVPQKGRLFAGTIESNLKYSGPDVTDEAMKKAAEIAQAAGFIEEKEGGYEGEISQGGTNVSGGQRQRLAIARAVAKKPKIFVFDDSFSALDYKTDSALRHALAKNLGDTTILIVAQRIATILRADKIIVLEEGQIVGEGTHSELMKSCDVYREIAASQLSEKELTA